MGEEKLEMKTINGRSYPGTLKGNFHTLKQMRQFFRTSKKVNKEYWLARIYKFIKEKNKFQSLFGKRKKK